MSDEASSGGIAAFSDSRSLVLSSSSIPSIISFKWSWSPTNTLLHQLLSCKVSVGSVKREPTFYLFKVDVAFGCFGKFLDICLHLNNQQNWEEQKTALAISGRHDADLAALRSSYVSEAEHFFF